MPKTTASLPPPSQLGFGFEVTDTEGNPPGFLFAKDDVYAAIDTIQQAHWASVDVETTGLTDASIPVTLTPQEWKQGAFNDVRLRTIQARVPTVHGRSGPRVNYVFDVDRLSPPLVQAVTDAILSRKLFIAHNAGFDLYWLRKYNNRQVMPKMVLDSMLLTRLLRPELVLKRAELIKNIKSKGELAQADAVEQAAWKSLISGASGGSLADVVLALFGVILDKTYQKPNNWTGLLSFEHYDYAVDDVVWADRIVCDLLNLQEDGDIYQAYLAARARSSTLRLLEPQVPELVLLREHGMPLSQDVGMAYVAQQREVLAQKVNELIALEPPLEPYREALADPDSGLDDALKNALASAFEERGVKLRTTATTGAPQVGEKDLRACRAVQLAASRPLFNAWVAVCRAKKSSNMALEVVGFSKRSADGRVRSLLSHGPVTGRLSASEPNCFPGCTEILTENGWVRFDALEPGTKVAQYDGGTISFVAPEAYIKKPFQGRLTQLTSTALHLLSTPDHRCLVIDKETGQEQVHAAQDYPKGFLQPHAGMYGGGQGLLLTEKELRFLVAAQAVGVWVGSKLTFKFKNLWKLRRFEELFGLTGTPCDPHGKLLHKGVKFRLHPEHPLCALALKYLGQANEFGSWVLNLSRAQMSLFINETAEWQQRFVNLGTYRAYSTKSKRSADWVQTAYALSGVRAHLVRGHAEKKWHVRPIARCTSSTDGVKKAEVPYNGLVYCVSVPSGFIVVRHENAVAVTGNCQQFPRDQVFRAMCMSPTKKDCEQTRLGVTERNKDFLAKVSGHDVEVGGEVSVDSSWLAALFWADKYIPEWPAQERDALNAHIDSLFTHYVVSSDFGALDVRVGAALCIRAQREMLALAKGHPVMGPVQPSQVIVDAVEAVVSCLSAENPRGALAAHVTKCFKTAGTLQKKLIELSEEFADQKIKRGRYFALRSAAKDALLAAKLGGRFAQCLALGLERGEQEYSALRDAFVADIDIHTFTGMKLVGRDPMKEFAAVAPSERKALEKKLKKELGPRRQQGKIANLSLLYGMADAGFQEAAARGYDEHWTLQEANEIRSLWMDAYPEVELWHLWTECLQAGVVYVPEMGRDKPARTGWWMARTLSGREIVAHGLNAALSYQDQSSGADILGLIMHRLYSEHRAVFDTAINQVHDEIVFCWPQEHHAEYLPLVEQVMVECANHFTMPYGVPCAVSPACGVLWIKD